MSQRTLRTTLNAWLPDLPREQLEARARHLRFTSPDRAVVNMLRHRYTDYEAHKSQERYVLACVLIMVRYPWLADECRKQVERRRIRDYESGTALHGDLPGPRAQEKWAAHVEQRARDSRQVVKGFALGSLVAFSRAGREFDGEVVSRRLDSGKVRVRIWDDFSGRHQETEVFASDLSPRSVDILEAA